MTRQWVRTTTERLQHVVDTFTAVERNIIRLAEELGCTPGNARHLLRKAELLGLIGPDWRARKAPTGSTGVPETDTAGGDTPTVAAERQPYRTPTRMQRAEEWKNRARHW